MKTTLRIPAKMKLEINFLKNLCVALLLFSGMAFGQIVNIPDANFKQFLTSASTTYTIAKDSNGNYITIDVNHDGLIQNTEAELVYELNVNSSSTFLSLVGIESFINLTKLSINSVSITSLNLNGLISLQNLTIAATQITSLDLTGLTNLKTLYCSNNSQLNNLSVSNLLNLQNLTCQTSILNNLNVSGCISLLSIDCHNNLLTSIDLSGLINITNLECSHNLLGSLDFSSNPHLGSIYCSFNNLSSLNLLTCDLYQLECANNNISTLDFTGLVHFNYLKCSYNTISNLDFSTNPLFNELWCNNNNLQTINLKNGKNQDSTFTLNSWAANPNLNYICIDLSELNAVQTILAQSNLSNVNFNAYCSLAPGGNYNTIIGSIIFDANNNGCDYNDITQSNIRLNIINGANNGATFTNSTGNFTFYTQTGSFVLTPVIENPTWFTISPATATIPFVNNNNNITTQNFCIAANGVHNDVEVVISPINLARPGFDAIYNIVYKNKGNQALSGNVNFTYNDAVLDFVSATVAPNSQNTGVLNWSYANLLPFENRSFYVTLHVNAPIATPPVNIGDVLSFNAAITPMISDGNPSDNSFTYNQTVVGSFDPNNITCLEGDIVPPSTIGSYLHYGVNFENTGTYPAENIVVKVVIDTAKYDVNSLQMLNTSNPAYTRIIGNVVEFIFKNIMLDTGGHGNVLFKIKTNNNLVNGDIVSKRADIFFDYNAPINTGMANTTFQLLNNGQFVIDNSIEVSPNPTSSIISINGTSSIKSVQVYDVQGRLLETKLVDDAKTTINISDKTNGIYFLKITSENGSKVEKIVKE